MSWTVKPLFTGRLLRPRTTHPSAQRSTAIAMLSGVALALSLTAGSAAAAPSRYATDLKLQAASETATDLLVEFSAAPTFTARYVKAQRRLIVDVAGAGVKGAPPALAAPGGLVAGAMLQAFNERGAAT